MEAWMNNLRTAIRLHQQGELDEAETHYREVLEAEPNQPLALHSLGLIAYDRGDFEDAADFVHEAISLNPNSALQYNTIGVIYEALDQIEKATQAYQQAILLDINYAEAYKNLASAQKIQGQFESALANYQKAVRSAPNTIQTLLEYGDTLYQLGHFAEASVQYQNIIALQPNFAEAHDRLATCLQKQGILEEAEIHAHKATEIDPEQGHFLNNLAAIQQALGKLDEALTTSHQYLRLAPNTAESLYCSACVQRDMGRLDEAIHNNQRAISIQPDFAEAHWNLAVSFLLAGRMAEGWEQFGWRRQIDYTNRCYPHEHPLPDWQGESFIGKRLYVHCEQGMGDAIQFVRLLHQVKSLGGTIILGAWKPLVSLFETLPCVDKMVSIDWHTRPIIHADFKTSLLDLPGLLRITWDSIPSQLPYLTVDSQRRGKWEAQVCGPQRKVGLVWAGSARHHNNRNRSLTPQQLSPLLDVPDYQFYSLQTDIKDPRVKDYLQQQNLPNLGEQVTDFADTAALIDMLDLVITVDTAVLHLAAALNKPTWALIPYSPDWRWQLQRTDCPWYPSLKLFRQSQPGDWTSVIEHVAATLADYT